MIVPISAHFQGPKTGMTNDGTNASGRSGANIDLILTVLAGLCVEDGHSTY